MCQAAVLRDEARGIWWQDSGPLGWQGPWKAQAPLSTKFVFMGPSGNTRADAMAGQGPAQTCWWLGQHHSTCLDMDTSAAMGVAAQPTTAAPAPR